MKDIVLMIVLYIGLIVSVVSFWVWIATLLIWKIFAIVGASTLIYPSFFIMVFGAIVAILCFIMAYISVMKL